MNLLDTKPWSFGSGSLPLSLDNIENHRYIMLDGGYYDFCLDLSGNEKSEDKEYADSWSSNAKNYITVIGNKVIVANWQKKERAKLPIDIVKEKFSDFLSIVAKQSYQSDDDVVPYFVNAFRKIRNFLGSKASGEDSLYLLLKTLVSLENGGDITNVDCKKWKLEDIAIPQGFEYLSKEIIKGVNGIKPNLDYILRHSAGPLFEEANREVSAIDNQLDLFDGFSSKIVYERELYSSIHYTPIFLARSLVENTISKLDLSKTRIRVLDPSCGSATLLLEFLRQIKQRGYKGIIEIIGFDRDRVAVNTAIFLLDYEKRIQADNLKVIYKVKAVDDSLKIDWGANDVVIMNPPFLSWKLLDDDGKDVVLDTLKPLNLKKRPNQAAAFFYKAVNSLNENGIISSVLPSSLLASSQYDDMRDEVSKIISLRVVGRLGNFVFDDALTDASIIIGEKNKLINDTLNIWCRNKKGSAYNAFRSWRQMVYKNQVSSVTEDYSIYTPKKFPYRGKSWSVISKDSYDFYNRLEIKSNTNLLKRLVDIFEIRQGIIAGRKNIFEVSSDFYDSLPDKEKKLYRPLIESGSINTGFIQKDRFLWYPYGEEGLLINSEEELISYQHSFKRLSPYKNELLKRKSVDHWWALTWPRKVLFKARIHLFSQRFGSSSSFGISEDQNFVIEEGNIMNLKGNERKQDYYFYLSLFCSSTFENLLSIYSKRIMQGYDLGEAQIKDIPLINLDYHDFRATEIYTKLCYLGKKLSNGNIYVKYDIDHIVQQLYLNE